MTFLAHANQISLYIYNVFLTIHMTILVTCISSIICNNLYAHAKLYSSSYLSCFLNQYKIVWLNKLMNAYPIHYHIQDLLPCLFLLASLHILCLHKIDLQVIRNPYLIPLAYVMPLTHTYMVSTVLLLLLDYLCTIPTP